MSKRLLVSLVVYVLWVAVTLIGGKLVLGGEEAALEELVKNGINWAFVAAIAVLLVSIALFRWRDLRFTAPHSLFAAMWFPALVLLAISSIALLTGLPTGSVLFFVALNTFFVGFSEEVMFRGVLFRALELSMRIWPAIILTCVLFGAVHVLNGFNTGDWNGSTMQAVTAAMSGLVFVAIVIRTGSLWPAIIYHWLWDCVLFLLGAAPRADDAMGDPATLESMGAGASLLPMALALPNFLWGLWLLRKVRNASYRAAEAQPA